MSRPFAHSAANYHSVSRRSSRRIGLILLPALLLALLWQGITVQPAAAQEGSLICGAPVPVLAVMNNSYSAEPVLNQDGSSAIFWSTANPSAATSNGDGNIEVFAVDLDLTQPSFNPQFRQLTHTSGSILGGFNLAPTVDGNARYVAFFSDRDLVSGQNSDANFEIFRLDTTNNQVIQVTKTVRGSNLFPSISADGRRIAFISDISLSTGGSGTTEEQRNLEIFIADLSNPAAISFEQVTTTTLGLHNNDDPVLSGDGRTLAYVSDVDGNSEIYRYTVGSRAPAEKVTNTSSGVSAHPSLSFDGSHLVFLSDQALESGKTTGGNPQVFMFPNPQTGNGFFQVTQAGIHGHPVIDDDGNRLSYQRVIGTQEDILLYDVDNRAERQISASASGRTRLNPSISANGTVIAYEDTGAIFVVNCPIADLSLAVEPVPSAIAGAGATYRWSVTNNGTSSAAGVTVRGFMPTGFTLDTANAAVSPECSQSGAEILCTLPLVTVNETRTVTLPVNLAPDLLGAASILVETFSQNVTDPAPGNNTQTLITVVDAEADLRLTQPVTIVVAPLIDEPITYTLQLVNDGPSVARDVRITNTLPAELTFVSAPGCSATEGIVTCDVTGVMTPNSVLTRTVVALVTSLSETSIVNEAVVASSTRDPQLANNRSLRTDRINTTFDLAVTQAVAPAVLRAGAPITYTFAVSNLGPSLATSVEISLTLPAQFVPALGTGGRPLFCNTFTCTADIDTSQPFTIGLGAFTRQSALVTIPGRIDPAFSGLVTSLATVYSADDPLADRNLDNNDSTADNEVFQEADLTVEPITVLGEIVAGAPVTYVISALNNGPSVASNTVLTFSIEPGVALTGFDVNLGQCNGSSAVTCVLDVLTPTQRLVVTATGTINAALTGEITASAAVRSDTNDLTPIFDDRTRIDTVLTRAELTLRNQPSSPQAVSGQDNVLFDLVVTNLGPSLARTAVVTNVLPISTTANQILAPSGVSCGPLDRTIVCDLGDLSAGAPITISVRAAVNADAVGTLVNNASVASAITDLLVVDSVPVNTIQRADLRVTKSLAAADSNSNGSIDVGERVTYTVVVSNIGPSNATGIVISDHVSSILGIVVALPTQGSFANDLWTVGSLAAGRQTTLTLSALLGDATSGQTITNTALLQASNQPDPISNNNRSTVIFDVSLATDLAVAMSVSNLTPQVLDIITYQITVTNNGPEDASDVTVTNVLPEALEYVSHSPGSAAYDDVTGLWQIGDLNVGQQQVLTHTVRVVGSGNVVNSATVAGSLIDSNPANDTASAPILVGAAADLRLSQTFSDDTPNVDDDLVIVLTLINDGPDTANNVVVSYPIPALLTGAAVTPQSADIYTPTSGLWTVPTLASGASTTLTVRRTLNQSGSFSSVAEVLSSSLFDPDSTPGNGTANGEDDQTRTTVTVPPAADVAVTKSVNEGPFKEGDTVSYTILARNNGPDTATNVVITDTLPITLLNVLLPTILIAGDDGSDSSFTYYDVAQPGIVTGTLVWDVGTLTSGDTETLFLSLTVLPGTAGRTIADGTDDLSADQYDWRPENNLSDVISILIDGADLAVTKAVSDERPNVGETLVYTLTVTNNGPSDATNVVVTDPLPLSSIDFVGSSSTPTGSYNSGTGLWTIPALANQETATLLITTTVQANLVNQVITNTITSATSDVADGDQSNNTAVAVASVQQSDLRVSIQTPNPAPAEREITTFFIVVENAGPDIATSVVLTHALPISLTNRGGAPTQGAYTLAANRWNVGTLPVGASARLSFFAEPIVGSGGQSITLTIAEVTLDQEDTTAAITATGTITVLGSDLRVPLIEISDNTPATGNLIRYTATVENQGPSANSNVILTQTVPAGTIFSSAQSGATVSGNNVAWTLSLAAGASATRAMTVTVNAGAGTDLVASAVTASGLITTPDNFPGNNTLSITNTVNQPAQISLASLPTASEGITFTVNGVFTDTDSAAIASALVNYGDGSPVVPLTVMTSTVGSGVTGTFALNHTYADNGGYTVVITMTDSDGNAGSFSQLVTVQNVAPTVTARAPITTGVQEGMSTTVNNMVTFSDPGFSAFSTTETFTYTIDWGDGSAPVTGAVTGVVNGSAGTPTTGALSSAHTYADNGVYTVTVTIADDDGGSTSATFTITVSNVAPTVTATTNRTVAEAALLSITDIVTFTDPAWEEAGRSSGDGPFTYSINWGDGSTPFTGTATIDANGSLGVATRGSLDGSHTYADDDGSPITVTVTVTDSDGGSGFATLLVTVTNVNPTITAIAGSQAITEGLPLTIPNIVTFTDPGFNTETFTYSIDRGDGSPPLTGNVADGSIVTNAIVTNGSVGTPTVGTFDVTLVWANDDDGRPFTTTVTIFDDNGGSASGSFLVAVANTNPALEMTGPENVSESPSLVHTYTFTVTDTGTGETFSIIDGPSCGSGTSTGTTVFDDTTGNGSFQCIFPDGPSSTFTSIRVSDGTADDNETVLVTVANLDPVVGDDTETTDEATPVVIDVLDNDSDVPADTVTIGSVGTPTAGIVTIAGDALSLTYDPNGALESLAAAQSQLVTFTYNAVDEDGGSTTGTVVVTVNGLNDAPVLDGAVITTGLNDNAGPQNIFADVTVADVDTGATLTLEIQLSNASAGTISGGGFTAQGGGLYAVSPLSVAAANTAFDDAQFTPANNTGASGTFGTTFTVTATDDEAAADDFTSAALTITRVNDAPTLADVTSPVTFDENAVNAAPALIDSTVTFSDVDSADLGGGSVTVSYTAGGDVQDQLSVNNQGTSAGQIGVSGSVISFGGTTIGAVNVTNNGVNGASLVIDLNSSATVAAVDALIQNLTYANTSNTPNPSRTIEIVIDDGDGGTSTAVSVVINVTAQNDVPIIANLAADTVTFTEGDGATVIDQTPSATVTDDDSDNFDTGTLTISFAAGGVDSQDVLAIRNQGVNAGEIGVTGGDVTYGGVLIGTFSGGSAGIALVVTLNSAANPTSVAALLANITYENINAANPTGGNRTVRFVLTDGDGGAGNNVDATVTVVAVNDPPTLADVTSPVTFLENAVNAGAVVIDNDVTFGDVDSANFDTGSVTVSYTAGGAAQDQLSVNNQGNGAGQIGVSGSAVSYGGTQIGTISATNDGEDGATLAISLNASATVAAVEALIENLAYDNSSDAPNPARTIGIVVDDGDGAASASVSVVINVTPENDAPVITDLDGDTLDYDEGDPATVIDQGTAAAVIDDDSANFDTGTLTVSFTAGSDSAEDVLAIRDQGAGATNITISGGNVNYGGTLIGSFTGGSSGADLVVTLNSAANPTSVGALVRNITYLNSDAANPTGGDRTVRFVLTDGDGGTSQNYDTTVTVNPINSVPTLTELQSATFAENTVNAAPQIIDNSVTFSDDDLSDFDDGFVRAFFAGGGSAQDQLGVNNVGNGPNQIGVSGSTVSFGGTAIGTINATSNGANGAELVIELNANSSVAAVDALIENLTYANTSDTPITTARTFQIEINDGDGGAVTSPDSISITVTAENDPPAIQNLAGDTLIYDEGDPALLIDQGTSAVVTDTDSVNFNGGSLTVSFVAGSTPGEDELAINDEGPGAGNISLAGSNVRDNTTMFGTFTGGTGGTPLVISFTEDAATLDAVSRLIRNITYENSNGANPTAGARTVRFVLNDGDGGTETSINYDTTVTVTSTNSAPTLTDVTSGVTFLENAVNVTPAVIDNTVTFSDADSLDLDGGSVTVSYTAGGSAQDQLSVRNEGGGAGQIGVSGSTVSYGSTAIGTIDGTNNGEDGASLVVDLNANTTVAAVDALLQNLTYANVSDTPILTRTIQIAVADGDSGTSAPVSVVITVTAENDAPVLTTNITRTVTATSTNVITSTNLLVSDVDNTDTEIVFTLVTTPTQGLLELNATTLAPLDTFTQQDVNDGLLSYTHNAGTSDDDAFEFTVSDGAGGSIANTTFTIQVDGVGAASLPSLFDVLSPLYLPLIYDNILQRPVGGQD
ncbi:DUF11 domain-containing protein [bacterium]|nr:DUF11 domain-containing protein [bacterium]